MFFKKQKNQNVYYEGPLTACAQQYFEYTEKKYGKEIRNYREQEHERLLCAGVAGVGSLIVSPWVPLVAGFTAGIAATQLVKYREFRKSGSELQNALDTRRSEAIEFPYGKPWQPVVNIAPQRSNFLARLVSAITPR